MNMKKYPHLVNTATLSKHLGISRQAVQQWREKDMPFYQLGPKTILYSLKDVQEYFNNIGSDHAKKEVE